MIFFKKLLVALSIALFSSTVSADGLIEGDSRIQTLVYNENEIYPISTSVEFKSRIDLNPEEQIQTISIGDRVSWNLITKRNSIFISPLKKGKITNLMVLTNKRNYEFELTSKSSKSSKIAYVTRFFYPEIKMQSQQNPNLIAAINNNPNAILPSNIITPNPVVFPNEKKNQPVKKPKPAQKNLNYTISGPQSIAPLKVYDDGSKTYLEFSTQLTKEPMINILNGMQEVPANAVSLLNSKNKSYSVEGVYNQLSVRSEEDLIVIFNEKMLSKTATPAVSYKQLK